MMKNKFMNKYKTSVFTLLIFITSLFAFKSAEGPLFPSLIAENLDGKSINIPNDTKGKYTLVGLAYSQKSQQDLQTWFQPIYETFIAKPNKPALFDDSYDVNLHLILMFTGSNEGMLGAAKKKMQKELDPELKPYVLLYKGDVKKYKETLSLNDPDKPYFFVLNGEGKVVHKESGAYTEAKLEKIESILDSE